MTDATLRALEVCKLLLKAALVNIDEKGCVVYVCPDAFNEVVRLAIKVVYTNQELVVPND